MVSRPSRHLLSSIPKLLDLLKVVSRVEKRSGFSSTLGIDYDYFRSLSEKELDWNESTQTLTTVVSMNDRLVLPTTTTSSSTSTSSNSVVGTLSTFQALIDDLTTWAFVLADPQRGRAGVSVTLNTEFAPSSSRRPIIQLGDSLVIESKVNKVGTNVGFSSARVQTIRGEPVCFGSHVKFLSLGLVTDFLSSSIGWPLARLYANYGVQSPPDDFVAPPLAQLFETLDFVSDNRATCSITPSHASLGGPIHGGCQAILMELVATRYLHQQQPPQNTRSFVLHSMNLEYVTKPSAKQVELTVQALLPYDYEDDDKALIIPVQVVMESKGRVNSYGLLRFLKTSQETNVVV